jgi:hypothetical protein
MMTPKKWDVMFSQEAAIPLRRLKAWVEKEARAHLATLAVDETTSTEKLVEALYPRDIAALSLGGDVARTAIYKIIGVLARSEMGDCCEKGEVNGQFMGRPKRPWVWFCPPEQETCCMCGQPLPAEEACVPI